MKEFTSLPQESQNNYSSEEGNNDYSEEQYNDNNIKVVVNQINSNTMEIILKHNDESLMQLLVEIKKNGKDFNLSIFNNQENEYGFKALCTIDGDTFKAWRSRDNDTIQSIVNDNEEEIKKFIDYILIDLLNINLQSIIPTIIVGDDNINKIAKCFDINGDAEYIKNKDKIVEKIANAEIVIQENQPSTQQPNIQLQPSSSIIQNTSQWCLQNCCCYLNKIT